MADNETERESTEFPTGWPAPRADGVGAGLLALLGEVPAGCVDALPRIPVAAPLPATRRAAEDLQAPELPSGELGAALRLLDAAIDSHWTSQGLPRLDALQRLTGWALERSELPHWTRAMARRAGSLMPQPEPGPNLSDGELYRLGCELDFQRRLQRQREADLEHAALGPLARRVPRPDFRAPIDRRIAAENRRARRGH